MSYKVRLHSFEGPFDLLVYLIENARMDIYDIRISEITEQYIEYVNEIKKTDVAAATEFMVLAATLIDIKSRMILPRPKPLEGGDYEEDPRSALVEKLLEYRRFKECAQMLKEREELTALIYEKPQEDISEYTDSPDELLRLNLDQFAAAFDLFLTKKQRADEVRARYTRIERDRATMEDRMTFIREHLTRALKGGSRRISFKETVPDRKDKYDIAVSFVSVLQMMRDHEITAEQKSLYGDISISLTDEEDREIEQ